MAAMSHAKAVRRQDLYHDADSDSDVNRDDDEATAAARAALEALMARTLGDFGLLVAPKAAAKEEKTEAMDVNEPRDDDDDEPGASETKPEQTPADGAVAFSFRLFSSAPTAVDAVTAATAAVPTVLLYDDDVAAGEGGLASAPRPLSAYVAAPPTPEERAQLAQIAVAGEAVQAQAAAAQRNAWGLEVPWRARTTLRVSRHAMQALLANALPAAAAVASSPLVAAQAANALPWWTQSPPGSPPPLQLSRASDTSIRKRRPGKKRRILQRQRDKARAEQEAAAQAQLKSKEEHLLEKKKRLNRIKKLRRREKKRDEKAGGGGGGDGGSDSDGHASDGSDNTP